MSLIQKLSITIAPAALLVLSTVAPAAAASLYNITNIGSLQPKDLNDQGQVLGYGELTCGFDACYIPAFLYENGQLTDLPNGATAINNLGQTIGFDQSRLFLREKDASINILDTVSCSDGCGYRQADINDNSQVLTSFYKPGSFPTSTTETLILWDKDGTQNEIASLDIRGDGSVTNLVLNNKGQSLFSTYNPRSPIGDTAFFVDSGTETLTRLSGSVSRDQTFSAVDMNDLGQVAGWGVVFNSDGVGGYRHAFLWTNPLSDDLANDLGTLAGLPFASQANGINNQSQVVGFSDTSTGTPHAFLWENNIMTDLNSLISDNSGWELNDAIKINNKGQIVGTGIFNGQQRAFLLTPQSQSVPEPTSVLALLGLGAIGLSSLFKRQKKLNTNANSVAS